MKRFKLINNTLGWLTFMIAAFVYCSTIEPTASFWDCPEFITTGYRLEVGHPPGAPFFMLTANLFSQFASDATQVAKMVNMMSAILSAATILFLFWSISHLVRKLICDSWEDLEKNTWKLIAVEGSALVGALIYTFSDTFWFSAVEGEVYAYSSAFTAAVFWLILKWEEHADEPHSDRWLVLIMYMTGLSIGVHLLNLLCLPALVLVYYYRKAKNPDLKGSIIALAVSVVILAAVLYGVVPGIVTVGGWFELLFVNSLGMPFNTGEIIYIIILIGIVCWAVYVTQTGKSEKIQNIAFVASVGMLGIPFYGDGAMAVVLGIIILAALWCTLKFLKKDGKSIITARIKNTSLLCMLMLMIGYSSYALIVIRSSANPPMDQNSPEDIFTLGEYLSRDQYGQRPLLYGQAYTSQVALESDGQYCKPVMKKGANQWSRREKKSQDEKDEYFVVRTKDSYKYAQNMLFPRMWDSGRTDQYEAWMGGVDGTIVSFDRCGEQMEVKVPTQLENIRFFLSYQCNFMYWRYFMWNFVGRQNDLQGNGELEHGNWITGISFIDNALLGDQDLLPDELKENKGHNVFYGLPLLLGLLGLFWQAYRGKKGIQQFWVVFFLFFMTGLAIVIYLNQVPSQPRERDYAYAGSFYAFSIWCGMGVAAIIDLLQRKAKQLEKAMTPIAICIAAVCVLVPVQMASQTWDDHDRSGRYVCRDFGQNYLNTLQDSGNPIIFTNGDNDTFPLWYNQDTEGFRTDARVCNLSYLQTDWYIDQMKRPAYDSPSLPITWNRLQYCSGTNEYISVEPDYKEQILDMYKEDPDKARAAFGDEPFELKNVMKHFVLGPNDNLRFIPTDTLYVTVDKEAVKKSGMMMPTDSIPEKMVISLKGKRALYKGDLMMLEMIANAGWTRPIYVAITVGKDNFMNLGDNFIQEGLANRITPFTTTEESGLSNFDVEKVYKNFMTRYKFGGIDKPGIYLDETVMRMCHTHRRLGAELAMQLAQNGDHKRALKVLDFMEKNIPSYNVPVSYASGSLDMARVYAACGAKQKAQKLCDALWKTSAQYMRYYNSLTGSRFSDSARDCYLHIYIMQQTLYSVGGACASEKWLNEKEKELQSLLNTYMEKGGKLPEW